MRRISAVLSILCAAALSGCAAPGVWVTVRPRFDYGRMKVIAVLPFSNPSEYPDAEAIVEDKLVSLILQRGPYRIVTGGAIDAVEAAKVVSLGGAIDPAAAIAFGRTVGADGMLAGTVLQYRCDRHHEVRFYGDPFGFDEAYHEAYYDEAPVDWYKIDGVVEAGIRLIDASTGQVVWTDSRIGTASSYGSPPPLGEAEVLDRAADAAARKLVLGLIPHQEMVRVPPGSIFTCGGFIDHPLDIRADFSADDPTIYIVVELDRDFEGKEIELAVELEGTGRVVDEQRCTWGAEEEVHAFKEDTKALIARGGSGKYRAIYFIDGRKIAHADFHIRE